MAHSDNANDEQGHQPGDAGDIPAPVASAEQEMRRVVRSAIVRLEGIEQESRAVHHAEQDRGQTVGGRENQGRGGREEGADESRHSGASEGEEEIQHTDLPTDGRPPQDSWLEFLEEQVPIGILLCTDFAMSATDFACRVSSIYSP